MSDRLPELHPEYRALVAELAALREELARLLAEEQHLLAVVRPNLLALYQQKLGAWEIAALQAEVEARRTRRKLELAQAAINQGAAPDWAAIDGKLEVEFLAWKQRVREAVEAHAAAETRLAHLMSADDTRELKSLYHALVKALHPDLHPQADAGQHELWLRVQAAYERGDVAELRALRLLVETAAPPPSAPGALEALRRDRDALERGIADRVQRLAHLEAQPPFPLREKLADNAWVAAQRTALETKASAWDARRAALDAALASLLKCAPDGKLFGSN